jgi:hypothetical protein
VFKFTLDNYHQHFLNHEVSSKHYKCSITFARLHDVEETSKLLFVLAKTIFRCHVLILRDEIARKAKVSGRCAPINTYASRGIAFATLPSLNPENLVVEQHHRAA